MNEIMYYSDCNDSFEKEYLAVRKNEGFVYSDSLVIKLPNVSKKHLQYEQWKLRKLNSDAFCSYIENNKKLNHILEIGCGNGWFSNLIASYTIAQIVGLDINKTELVQANRVFKKSNLIFGYGNIFEANFTQKFDIIVFNASIHYFQHFNLLMEKLKKNLSENGEIHILDSKFYSSDKEIDFAKKRTSEYYKFMGQEKMIQYYFHHPKSILHEFEIIKNPNKGGLLGKLQKNKSPFGWYRYSC